MDRLEIEMRIVTIISISSGIIHGVKLDSFWWGVIVAVLTWAIYAALRPILSYWYHKIESLRGKDI